MSCPHTDTTLLWAYGEAPEEHGAHVAGCAECRALVAEHAAVATTLGPALSALRRPAKTPVRRVFPYAAVAALALAAAVALALRPDPEPPAPAPAPHATVLVQDPLDGAIDALDRDLIDLELELL